MPKIPMQSFPVNSAVANLPLVVALITALLRFVFMSYAGNFPLIIPSERYALIVLVGMVAYAVVARGPDAPLQPAVVNVVGRRIQPASKPDPSGAID